MRQGLTRKGGDHLGLLAGAVNFKMGYSWWPGTPDGLRSHDLHIERVLNNQIRWDAQPPGRFAYSIRLRRRSVDMGK